MANFDREEQKMVSESGIRKELGSQIAIAGVSGQTFTVATKLKKVVSGFGVMDTDQINAVATKGIVSSGQATFTRYGPISTSADTITYTLYGY